MPGAWHPPEVKARAIDLWRGLEGGKRLEPWEIAMSLSSCSPLARRVSEESIKGWICNYQQTGYAEGTRQHNARVRAEAAELQRRVVEERVDRCG